MMTLLLVVLAASPAAPLNTEGYRLYLAGQYPAALEKFQAAVKADPSHALSHYNFAATLGLLRKQGKVCEFNAYPDAVLDELEQAVKLDEGRRKRMQKDKDFDSVRGTLRYQKLLGRNPAVDADARALLTALTWLAPAVGAFGNPVQLTLSANGTFTLSRMQMTDDGPKRDSSKGRWKLEGHSVTLDFAKPLKLDESVLKQARGNLTPEGHLVFESPDWNLSDARSECEA
jgi:tetratricopeptide (TPR) repeat protein